MPHLTDPDLAKLLAQSVDALNRGENQAAEKTLDVVLRTRSDLPQAQMLMGAVRLTQDRTAEAEALLEQALAASPGQPMVLFYLGNARRARGNPAAALAAYQDSASGPARFFRKANWRWALF